MPVHIIRSGAYNESSRSNRHQKRIVIQPSIPRLNLKTGFHCVGGFTGEVGPVIGSGHWVGHVAHPTLSINGTEELRKNGTSPF